ncbi:MAG: glycosyl transferase [Bacteroidales bacterium]|jgi:uncharacterized protein (TIGR00661 family)|nr:glycosyl transferase [Bacteroidales bacterium]MDN5350257.1 hypothetical protein [Bacteroidales bacterium]
MRILYAIQATGNGHLSRAHEILPHLYKIGQTDILLSGTQAEIQLNHPIKYRLKGLSFTFGKNGGVDIWNTYNEASILRLFKEYESLPVENYDLIINDFEPISAWAGLLKNIPCVSLSHQAALLEPGVPIPNETDPFGKFVLRNYAPAHKRIGFHFQAYSANILTPIIRSEIRKARPTVKGHYTVYLPAWDALELAGKLNQVKGVKWHIFSKSHLYTQYNDHITIFPVSNKRFMKSLNESSGVLCGAGFETPAEAIYLGKKLMVMPMKNQFEQLCNAKALELLSFPVIKNLKEKNLNKIQHWIDSDQQMQLSYSDNTPYLIEKVLALYEELRKTGNYKNYTKLPIPLKRLKIA